MRCLLLLALALLLLPPLPLLLAAAAFADHASAEPASAPHLPAAELRGAGAGVAAAAEAEEGEEEEGEAEGERYPEPPERSYRLPEQLRLAGYEEQVRASCCQLQGCERQPGSWAAVGEQASSVPLLRGCSLQCWQPSPAPRRCAASRVHHRHTCGAGGGGARRGDPQHPDLQLHHAPRRLALRLHALP